MSGQGNEFSGSASSQRMIFPLLWFFSAYIGFAWSTITALTVGASEAPSKRWRKLTDIYKIPEPRNGQALMPMDPAARAKWSVVLRPSWKDSYQKLWILDSLRFTYASERFLSGPLQMQACIFTFCSMTPQTWLLETPSLRNWNRKQQAGHGRSTGAVQIHVGWGFSRAVLRGSIFSGGENCAECSETDSARGFAASRVRG